MESIFPAGIDPRILTDRGAEIIQPLDAGATKSAGIRIPGDDGAEPGSGGIGRRQK